MFLSLPPTPALAPLIHAYWFVEDQAGVHAGRPIHTGPVPAAVLSVNLGRPNAAEDGTLVPTVALLGLQTRVRRWQSWPDTAFVMAMLTLTGVVRLFPHTGAATAGQLLELGAIEGDRTPRTLADAVAAATTPQRIARVFDQWFLARLGAAAPVAEVAPVAIACRHLARGGSVAGAARAAATDRRQLHRWCRRHLGMAPKALADLERLQASVRAIQSAHGDALAGFSDQAHQIRAWRRCLGVTPGAYRRAGGSAMAGYFSASEGAGPAFYL